jgi:leucyl/phenylalanyl-tRNA--protein transferase
MVPWLDPRLPPHFPDTRQALNEPNGLLAAGGQLSQPWLVEAYRRGIFPWFNESDPLMWWTPAPRTVLFVDKLRINRSMQKFMKKTRYRITHDKRFVEVMQACAEPRKNQLGSWITSAMIEAYTQLNQAGCAHSWECWNDDNILVGGLYGVSMGQVFFGESMFSRADYASRCCLVALAQSGQYRMIDCQMKTTHLMNMGAEEITRERFEALLGQYVPSQACR